MNFLKSTKGGPFGSAEGRIPEERGILPPLNPPLLTEAFKTKQNKNTLVLTKPIVLNKLHTLFTVLTQLLVQYIKSGLKALHLNGIKILYKNFFYA